MADFSRAEYSKNHKNSFVAALTTTRKYLEDLETEYTTVWEELEVLRKERAALIENAIKVLKDNNIKLGKQLCRCDNEELNIELEGALPKLGFKDLEEIKISIVKINMRYDKICELSKELIRISDELSKFRVREKDQDQEVVVNFKQAKKSKSEQLKEKVLPKDPVVDEEAEELEEVVSTKKAPTAVLIDFNEYLYKHKKQMDNTVNSTPVQATDTTVLDSIIEEEDLQVQIANVDHKSDLTEEVDDITKILEDVEEGLTLQADSLNINDDEAKTLAEEKDTEEFVVFKVEKDVTLDEIAKKVYDSADLWYELYKYGTNKGRIDRVAAEHKTTVENVCTKPGHLNGIELVFPVELVTYEPLEASVDKTEIRKAA